MQHFTLKDVAATLNFVPHGIVYLITSRQLAESELRIGNIRVWSSQEIEEIAEKLGISPDKLTNE